MANRRFIDFPIATTVGDSDIILIWQSGVNKQTTKATFLTGLPENLDELNDVAISGLTNGQILRYDSTTGKWENTDQGNLDLNDLNDVSIVSPSNGQVLVYNSSTSKWENSSGGFVPYTGAVTTVNLGAQTIQAGQFVKAGGTSSQFLKADGSIDSTAYGTGSVTSVGLTMPSAFSVANSPVTTAGTLAVTGAGTVSQYIRGDGSLADFPESSGGGSSVSYYLNGSVNQGTIGGVAYRELNKVPVLGAGTDFSINANGYIASFITDAGDPSLLEIPGGNWNFETYFSASSGGGSPTFYVELYKVSGTTATLIASNSGSPELIAFGTTLTSYFSTLAVPTTTLALTDRLAIRYYVTHSGRTITLHTEDNHLCQIVTTFTTGLTALNGLTAQVQNFAVGTSGTDFNIASATATHTFNLPTASATNRGALSSADWSTFNNKENAITAGTTAQYFRGDKTFQTLNTSVVPELTNLYYTEARVNANTNVAANTAARHNAVTLGTANGLSLSTQVLSLGLASAGVTGAISGTDWSTFNGKQNALGYTPVPETRTITINGTTQDLSANRTFNVGTVTSVGLSSATSGVTIGSTPVTGSGTITLAIATASGSQNGLLSSTDWTTFNSKQNALTNPVTGTGTTNYLAKFTGASTIGNSLTSDDGTNVTINGTAATTKLKIVSPLSSSLFQSGVEFIRTGVSGGSKIEALRDAAIGGVGLSFQVTANNTAEVNATYTSAINILNNGNVGIGTTSPQSKLSVGGNGYSGRAITAISNNADYAITFQQDNASGAGLQIFTTASTWGSFPLNISDGTSTQLRITSGGNLLVGTTTDNGARLQTVGGAVSFNNGSAQSSIIGTTFTGFEYTRGSTIFGFIGTENSASGGMRYNSVAGNFEHKFYNNSNLALTIASTGAATFSSSVTVNNNIQSNITKAGSGVESANFLQLRLYGTNAIGDSLDIRYLNNNGNNIANISAILGGDNVAYGSLAFSTRNYFTDSMVEVMRINNRGNVGIGTTSPGYKTVIQTANQTTGLLVTTNANDSETGLYIQPDHTNGIVKLFASGGTNKAFAFLNGNTEAMRITSSGNVLIGTTTDNGARLNVQTSGSAVGGIRLTSATNTNGSGFVASNAGGDSYFGRNSSTGGAFTGAAYATVVYGGGNYPMGFYTNDTEQMRITSGGNLLLGSTTDNGSKLQVNGAIRTAQPVGTTSNGWLLGRALVSGTSTPNRWIRVQIGLEYYDILAVYMGTL